ncbi:hypothetical protein V6N13_140349 [Hibiscus sabdariffa]|uniref:Uncharacterized protein n=1 Tax=Hibiscus sabdariffa TaxID=183260 RepID=A0ABR2QAQ0_9ROSI
MQKQLGNLQITVQDLKRKVDITETEKESNGTVKEQLEEAEEAIVKLESDESGTGSARKQEVSEQAQRGSEKIGCLAACNRRCRKYSFSYCSLMIEKTAGNKPDSPSVKLEFNCGTIMFAFSFTP